MSVAPSPPPTPSPSLAAAPSKTKLTRGGGTFRDAHLVDLTSHMNGLCTSLYESKAHADTIIIVGDMREQFLAHSLILIMHSSVLERELLKSKRTADKMVAFFFSLLAFSCKDRCVAQASASNFREGFGVYVHWNAGVGRKFGHLCGRIGPSSSLECSSGGVREIHYCTSKAGV